jgi:hypothetical protein
LKDVCVFNGDLELARQVFPNAVRLLDACRQWENAEGFVEKHPGHPFVDWANVGKAGVCAPINAIYHIALNAAADTAERIGEPVRAAEWRARAGRIAALYHAKFWNEARGLYVDNVAGGAQSAMFSQHTQAITVLAGLHRVEATPLLQRTVKDESLTRTEPYFSFYLLEALGRNGLAGEGLDFIRRRWGAMIEQGATSFWEEWQTNGTFRAGRWTPRPRSHCHAWSAAPTAWLSRYVLGVRVEEYGGPIVIEPNPCGLTEASGVVPTSYGPVAIKWRARDGLLSVTAKAPKGAQTLAKDPAGWAGKATFTINEL